MQGLTQWSRIHFSRTLLPAEPSLWGMLFVEMVGWCPDIDLKLATGCVGCGAFWERFWHSSRVFAFFILPRAAWSEI